MFDIGIFEFRLPFDIVRSLDRTRRSLVRRIRRTFLPDTVLEILLLRFHVFLHKSVELLFGHDLFEVFDRESLLRGDVGFP